MSNTDQSKTKRAKVAEHYLIDAQGNEVEEAEEATGIGYKLLGVDEPFEFQLGDKPAPVQLLFGLFGAKTLATNESSQARNSIKGAASPADQLSAVKERFDFIVANAQWSPEREGGVGAKVDVPTLVKAWIEVSLAKGKTVSKTPAELEQLLTDKPELVKALRKDPELNAAYARLRGAEAVDAAALMDTI